VKPLGTDLTRGGALASVWLFGEAVALTSSHLPNSDPDSTQILTRHNDVQSQTVSQFKSSGTTPTSKFLQLNPSRLLKHLRMGLV
jgi:hypothetical protein